MNPFVNFLTDLGFTDVRQNRVDGVELFVAETLKAARRCLRSHSIQFKLVESKTTPNSVVQDFYAIENRRTIGRVSLTSYATHSTITLTDLRQK